MLVIITSKSVPTFVDRIFARNVLWYRLVSFQRNIWQTNDRHLLYCSKVPKTLNQFFVREPLSLLLHCAKLISHSVTEDETIALEQYGNGILTNTCGLSRRYQRLLKQHVSTYSISLSLTFSSTLWESSQSLQYSTQYGLYRTYITAYYIVLISRP